MLAVAADASAADEEWLQFKYDARHSGDMAARSVDSSALGLIGAVPLTDGVYASPVIADGRIYAVDGAGVAFCIDAKSLEVLLIEQVPVKRGSTRLAPVSACVVRVSRQSPTNWPESVSTSFL